MNRPVKQVIVIRRDLKMRRGKEIAQGAHAAMQFLIEVADFRRYSEAETAWINGNYRKVVVRCDSETELRRLHETALAAGLQSHLITDHGLTEFQGIHTPTCIAIGPDWDERIDVVTGGLELM